MITVIGFRDPWSLQAFCMRERARLPLIIIDTDLEQRGWASLKIAINHAKSIAAKAGLELDHTEIEAIDARSATPWYDTAFVQVRVGIRTNPAAWLCWPPQTFAIQPGQIALVPAGWQSMVNCGETQAITLVLSLRMSDPERTRAPEA